MSRTQFTTTIDQEIQDDFREKCKANDVKMNDVLEVFMDSYIQGKFKIAKNISYKLEEK